MLTGCERNGTSLRSAEKTLQMYLSRNNASNDKSATRLSTALFQTRMCRLPISKCSRVAYSKLIGCLPTLLRLKKIRRLMHFLQVS